MGKWVTIKGAHVYIEDDGTVTKGPKSFIKKTKTVNERLDEEFHKGNITRQQYEKAKTDGWTHADLDKAISKKKSIRKTRDSQLVKEEITANKKRLEQVDYKIKTTDGMTRADYVKEKHELEYSNQKLSEEYNRSVKEEKSKGLNSYGKSYLKK